MAAKKQIKAEPRARPRHTPRPKKTALAPPPLIPVSRLISDLKAGDSFQVKGVRYILRTTSGEVTHRKVTRMVEISRQVGFANGQPVIETVVNNTIETSLPLETVID